MTNLLEVRNLTVRFAVKRSRGDRHVTAVDNVSFVVPAGRTLGLVGESGSGKTTVALAAARLVEASEGEIFLDGAPMRDLSRRQLRRMRQKVQIIFQDPYSSLNPRFRAEDVVREPLLHTTRLPRSEQDRIVDGLFEAVGLRPEQKRLYPHQFSGGQRQRIGIARALSTRPKLVICDEPVSALDVAVQAQILNLLKRLQRQFNLTYLFISHDLGVVQHMCDDIVVMYMGRIVEAASRERLYADPRQEYTRSLLAAVPDIHRAIGTGGNASAAGEKS